MKNKWTEEKLIDYLAGELPEEETVALAEALKNSPDLQKQYEELSQLLSNLANLPDRRPSERLQSSFELMLTQARKRASINPSRSNWLYLAPRMAAAIALLVIGTFIGIQLNKNSQQADQLVKLERELAETKSVMLQLVQNDRTSSRIKAVNLTQEFGEPDPEIIASLSQLLKTDKSPNVRLAAIDALTQFAQVEAARKALKESLLIQDKPVVQIALIHALVQIQDVEALPYLDKMIEREDVLDKVKDEARLGQFKML